MGIYYLWHRNNEEEHLVLMAHKGAEPRNLFINEALSPDRHDSTGRVIHQRRALAPTGWMDFLLSDPDVGALEAGTKRPVAVGPRRPPPLPLSYLGTSTSASLSLSFLLPHN